MSFVTMSGVTLGGRLVFQKAGSVLGVHAASIGAIAILILQRSIHPKYVSLSTKVICLLAFGAFGLRLLPLNFCITAGLASFAAYIIDGKTLQGKVVGEKNPEIERLKDEMRALNENHRKELESATKELESARRAQEFEIALNEVLHMQIRGLQQEVMDGRKALEKNNDSVLHIEILRNMVLQENERLLEENKRLLEELELSKAQRPLLPKNAEDDSQGIGFNGMNSGYDFDSFELQGGECGQLKDTIYRLQVENTELSRQLDISMGSEMQATNKQLLEKLAEAKKKLDSLQKQNEALLAVQESMSQEIDRLRN